MDTYAIGMRIRQVDLKAENYEEYDLHESRYMFHN